MKVEYTVCDLCGERVHTPVSFSVDSMCVELCSKCAGETISKRYEKAEYEDCKRYRQLVEESKKRIKEKFKL